MITSTALRRYSTWEPAVAQAVDLNRRWEAAPGESRWRYRVRRRYCLVHGRMMWFIFTPYGTIPMEVP